MEKACKEENEVLAKTKKDNEKYLAKTNNDMDNFELDEAGKDQFLNEHFDKTQS